MGIYNSLLIWKSKNVSFTITEKKAVAKYE